MRTKHQKGFTLVELLVVIAIVGLLASIILSSLTNVRVRGRDTRRLADMKQIQTALSYYYDKYGRYPDSDNQGCGGWDSTGDGDMVAALQTDGFIRTNIKDVSINDTCGNYAYYRYSAGSEGCNAAKGSYYVLGIRDMETTTRPHPASPGWNCTGRDWQGEFDWVTGVFEK